VTVFVALLRGVNVGGAHSAPMSTVRETFAQSGGAGVATWLQSGNVVFEAAGADGVKVVERARASLRRRLGFDVSIILRDARSWLALCAGNPFLNNGADAAHLHVCCLSEAPSVEAIARLDPNRSPPDAFAIIGANVYLKLPNGVARSRMTNPWFDKTLGVVSTMRNWRTVARIAEALGQAGSPR
jgi:uncharacterized protein (DUF1697 family)